MNDLLVRNHASVARYSPSAGAAFTPAGVENSAKRDNIAFYR
jgi:hypothetical protein